MSKRSERREAERAARKIAFQELRAQRAQSDQAAAVEPATVDATATEPVIAAQDSIAEVEAARLSFQNLFADKNTDNISEAQLNANRENAQLSTGPATEAGKARSSQNALKHGLTSRKVLLPGEDPDEYQHALNDYLEIHKPATEEERRLVQTIVDCYWRLQRLERIETAILFKGHLEFEDVHKDKPEARRGHLIHADAYLKYERQLRNLSTQESRLRRTMDKAAIELKELKAERIRQENIARHAARQAESKAANAPNQPANGFDFSNRSSAASNPTQATRNLRKRAA